MSGLPEEIRKELRSFISKKTDETIDLIVNLVGKPIGEKRRTEIKRQFELKEMPKFENAISKAYQIGLELQKEYQKGTFETGSLKDRFYFLTDAVWRASVPGLPRNVHAMNYLFKLSEDLLTNFRLTWHYLEDTNYYKYLQALKKLMDDLKRGNSVSKSWEILTEFRRSKDFFLLLQATLQRLIKYYQYLDQDFLQIEKKQVDKYLEIYAELSGHYEKFISLMVTLVQLSETNMTQKYEVARSRPLSRNIAQVERSGWSIFVSGFNKNIRNAIAHKTLSVDVVKQTVEFIDRNEVFVLTFHGFQQETRALSALLLILLHVFVSIFCLSILLLKEVLDNLPN